MAHRHGEDDDRVDVALALEQVDEMCAPARRHPAPDRLPDEPVGVARILFGPAQVPVALQTRDHVAGPGEDLTLVVAGVRRRPPPRALHGPAAVRRDDQVGTGLVQALPELPPRRRAAVAEIEVDGGRDRQNLRSLHSSKVRRQRGSRPSPRTNGRRVRFGAEDGRPCNRRGGHGVRQRVPGRRCQPARALRACARAQPRNRRRRLLPLGEPSTSPGTTAITTRRRRPAWPCLPPGRTSCSTGPARSGSSPASPARPRSPSRSSCSG